MVFHLFICFECVFFLLLLFGLTFFNESTDKFFLTVTLIKASHRELVALG